MGLSQVQIIRSLAEALQWFEKALSRGAEVARKPYPCFARLPAVIEVEVLDPTSNPKKARTFGTDIIKSLGATRQ